VPSSMSATGSDGGDSWNWSDANPAPRLAPLDHQSNTAVGIHEHWFTNPSEGLVIHSGDTLFAWVYPDPATPPSEVMLMWTDGSGWEHRAFWGANSITYGHNGAASRFHAGPLPAAGRWTRLSVPAAAVGLDDVTATGMGFSLFGGRAAWDTAGKTR